MTFLFLDAQMAFWEIVYPIYKNIAYGYGFCADVMKGWDNSAGRRANMLDRNMKKIGVAGYRYKGIIYWVQVFSS